MAACMEMLLAILSLAGTAVFALSGALLGLRKGYDFVGLSFVATITGVGGGTVRDLLLGDVPVGWVREPVEIVICIAAAFLASLLNRALVGRRLEWLLYADAAGLALFAVLGAAKADAAGAHPLVAILFGAMSASFGGIIRDIMCGERPVIFLPEIYVSAALLAAATYLALPASLDAGVTIAIGVLAGLSLRLMALHLNWTLPFPRYRPPAED